MSSTVLRPLSPKDAEGCDAVILSLPYHFGIEAGREACARAVRTSDGWVAEADGRVVGFLTVRPSYEQALEITWMAVHADHRRRGIGRALIDALADPPPAGVRYLVVTTLSEASPEDRRGQLRGNTPLLPAKRLPADLGPRGLVGRGEPGGADAARAVTAG